MSHFASAGVCLSVIMLFAGWLALSPRHFHDLLVYQEAFSDWQHHVNVYQRFLTSSDPTGGHFAYPPLFLTAFYPFSMLPPFNLVLVWDTLNLLFLFLSITLLVKLFLPEKKGFFILKTFSLSLFSFPVLFTFQLGQTTLWVLFSLSAALFLYSKKKERLAGLPILAAAGLKFFPAFFLFPFVCAKNCRSIALCSFFLLFVTGLLFPRETQTFIFQVLPHRSVPTSYAASQSLDAFLLRVFRGINGDHPLYPAPEMFLTASVALKCGGGALFLFFLLSKFIGAAEKLILAIFSFLLFSPVAWVHYHVFLIVFALWHVRHSRAFTPLQNGCVKTCVFILYFSFIAFSYARLPHPAAILWASLPLAAVIVLYAFFAAHLLKRVFARQGYANPL